MVSFGCIVLQWIYGTISTNLLHTVLAPNLTAEQAWGRLENIFQDNKNARAAYLENQFTQVHMDGFPNISAYCQELKVIADQLSNVGASLNDQRLVLQLISGLNENYDSVVTFMQQKNPLPQFNEARSRLVLEETRKAKQEKMGSNTSSAALLTTNEENPGSTKGNRNSNCQNRNNNGNRGRYNNAQGNQNNNRGNGKNNTGRGKGQGQGRGHLTTNNDG